MALKDDTRNCQLPGESDNPVQLSKLELLFDQILDCPTGDRDALLRQLCPHDLVLQDEVSSLVQAAECAQGFLSTAPTAVDLLFADKLEPRQLLDRRFGPYRLLKVLEHGGMGVVYLAERVDGHYEDSVAIKFSNYKVAISSLMHRFSRETQILAQLRHPNVARMLDAGTSTDGYPYIVMEYVDGESIDQYCATNSCSLRTILSLMQQVCEAVQHAHQNLIVHCDLKPSNILVTCRGNPVLLDFGIAQLLDPFRKLAGTSANPVSSGAMTPQFAAPEQKTGEAITTSTDVYALGNVLYRLVTGCAPQCITFGEILSPSNVAPACLQKHLKGDLDNIILKALNREPGARYESAQGLSDDIGRYLEGDMVQATPPDYLYRCKKYLQRHKLGVALSSMVIVSLAAGASGTTLQWQQARLARIAAESNLDDIRQLANKIVFEVPNTISALPGSTPVRERLLSKSVAYLDRLAHDQQDAGIRQELANAYHELANIQGNPMISNLGNPDSALLHYQKSIEIRKSLLEEDTENSQLKLDLATSYALKSGIYATLQNNFAAARRLTEQCVELLETVADIHLPGVFERKLKCLNVSAHWANSESEYEIAAHYLAKAHELLSTHAHESDLLSPNERLRQQGRLHEEWAEISAENDKPLTALWHESQRLKLWIQISTKHPKRERLLGFAYQGLADRLASANEHIPALHAYREALLHWGRWRERYPSDISAAQAIAIVHAEIADLIWQNWPRSSTWELACKHYSQSIRLLDASVKNILPLPKRYSWSPTASEIREQYTSRCTSEKISSQAFVLQQ